MLPRICSHNKKIIEIVVPLLRIFLILSVMPLDLERCVATEINIFTLLKLNMEEFFTVNISWALTLCLLNSNRFHFLLLDVSSRILCSHLVMSNISDEVNIYIFLALKDIFFIKAFFLLYLFN